MKLLNIFKKQAVKETEKVLKSNVEALDKNQLEKVIGGGGSDVPSTVEGGPIRGLNIK